MDDYNIMLPIGAMNLLLSEWDELTELFGITDEEERYETTYECDDTFTE